MHVPARVIRPHAVWLASAEIPTRFGTFATHVFRSTGEDGEPKEHVALVHGDIEGASALPVRVHSECMTSEVFGSLKCDCKEQLEAAQAEIVRRGRGAILYLRQEGRGIGLANAITPPPQPVAAPTAPTAPDLKEAKEAKDSVATYRNEILQLLSMVKLTEILTLTDIVD